MPEGELPLGADTSESAPARREEKCACGCGIALAAIRKLWPEKAVCPAGCPDTERLI